MRWLLLTFALIAVPASAQVSIEDPWSRATAPGAKVGAGYFTIRNQSGKADKLLGASSPAAAYNSRRTSRLRKPVITNSPRYTTASSAASSAASGLSARTGCPWKRTRRHSGRLSLPSGVGSLTAASAAR